MNDLPSFNGIWNEVRKINADYTFVNQCWDTDNWIQVKNYDQT